MPGEDLIRPSPYTIFHNLNPHIHPDQCVPVVGPEGDRSSPDHFQPLHQKPPSSLTISRRFSSDRQLLKMRYLGQPGSRPM